MPERSWLRDLLCSVQLESYYLKFKEDNITHPTHFDHVTQQYLTDLGLSIPAQRRLREAVKKEKKKDKKHKKKYGKGLPNLNIADATYESIDQRGGLIDESSIEEGEELGDGSFGVVLSGTWMNGTNRIPVAIKSLKVLGDDDMGALQDFILEMNAMHQLHHTYLLPLYGIVLSSPIKMVIQLAPGGSLLSRLRKQKLHNIMRLCEFCVQIAKGMQYLSNERFIHRDLACRNILLYSDSEIKIGDFGLMRRLSSDVYKMEEKRKIPIAWSAPESLRKREFSIYSDVWSFGIVMWEIFTFGGTPWRGITAKEIVRGIESGKRLDEPSNIPASFWKYTLQTWLFDPNERPNFENIVTGLLDAMPKEAKASHDCTQRSKLNVRRGNTVYILKENEMGYLAQSASSLEIGSIGKSSTDYRGSNEYAVPRNHQRIDKPHISHPVENSFIHAGHTDARGGDSWGDATLIDPSILANPIIPGSSIKKDISPRSSKAPPKRPPKPVSEPSYPPPQPPQAHTIPTITTEDLLGSIDDELKQRPYQPEPSHDFSQMHAQIASTFKRNVAAAPIERADSFESLTDDDDGISRQYYQPPNDTRIYEREESYESVYEVTPVKHSIRNSHTPSVNVTQINPLPVRRDITDQFINTSSPFPVQNQNQPTIGSNPFQMADFNPVIYPAQSTPSHNPPAPFSVANPFLTSGPAIHSATLPVRPFQMAPLSPVKRSLTPEPSRSRLGSGSTAIRSLTPNPEKPNGNYQPFNITHDRAETDYRKMSLPVNESHFSDLQTQAFDWFKPNNPNLSSGNDKQQSLDTLVLSAPGVKQKATVSNLARANVEFSTLSSSIPESVPQRKSVPKPKFQQPRTVSLPEKKFSKRISPPTANSTVKLMPSTTSPTDISTSSNVPMNIDPTAKSNSPLQQTAKHNNKTVQSGGHAVANPIPHIKSNPTISPRAPSPANTVLPIPAEVTPPKLAPAIVTPAKVTLAKVTLAKVTPAKVTPAKVTPAIVTPAKVTPAKVTPAKVTPPKVTLAKVTPEPNIAFMSSNDAVEALRKKYGLISESQKDGALVDQKKNTQKNIFDTTKKMTALEIKQHEMQVTTLLKQCPGSSTLQAERALKEHTLNMPKALKALKLARIFTLAPEGECREALVRANGDPDTAYAILRKSCK